MEATINKTRVSIIQGDITRQATDAIVNAANSSLMGGGGVDGAIHRAGGTAILLECKKIVAKQGRLPTGQAVITTGGNLKAKYVIHTVGPIWRGGTRGEPERLASCYRRSLAIASERGIRSIAFPSISTGAYRYPIEQASRIAVEEVAGFLEHHREVEEVHFVLFSENDFEMYARTMKETLKRR